MLDSSGLSMIEEDVFVVLVSGRERARAENDKFSYRYRYHTTVPGTPVLVQKFDSSTFSTSNTQCNTQHNIDCFLISFNIMGRSRIIQK